MIAFKKNPLTIFLAAQAALLAILFLASPVSAGHHGEMKAPPEDIVEVAVSAGQFNTLAAALEAAGLVGTLQGEGPYTVFAPTDAAFAKLQEGTLETLLKPENKDQLIAILTYHVVPGTVTAADVVKLDNAETVSGEMIEITVAGDNVRVNQAKVIATDIAASNGVIHVIDEVILPPAS